MVPAESGTMTTTVSLRRGHDVGYFNAGNAADGCAGAMAYYTKSGEPPGQWHGNGAVLLGLSGKVDPAVIGNLYMKNIGPGGDQLARPPKDTSGAQDVAVARAVHAYKREHPYASATELDAVRAKARSEHGPKSVPYFDLTVSAVKSVSVLHASYRVAAMQARARGANELAAVLGKHADDIEQALMDGARDTVDWLEANAGYTRTGYHSATTGEWRDGRGLTAALFLHHLSRDGDPHLHVRIAIWNRVQRADRADDKFRTLYGRAVYKNRLGAASVPDRFVERRLREAGFVMVPRADGNGCEVGGVSQQVMNRFSSRGMAVTADLARLAEAWERVHGRPPSARTLWLLHQQAGQNTRRSKAQARRTAAGQVHDGELEEAERLAAWEAQTTAEEMQALSLVYRYAELFARQHGAPAAPAGAEMQTGNGSLAPVQPDRVLAMPEKRRAARIAVA
jgi:TrwC relaxase